MSTTAHRTNTGWLHRLAHAPRQTWLRRALFQVHLWAGIGIGLIATVVGLSGSAIVYRHALETRLAPALYRTSAGVPLPADALIAHARELHRRWRLEYINTGGEPTPNAAPDPWIFYLKPPGSKPFERDAMVYLDPATGRYLGQQYRTTALHPATALDWIAELHYRLLAGDAGTVVNGIGALLLALLCITGAVIWWPGVRHWRSHLRIHWQGRWPRLNWDLHNVFGFWIALPLAVVSLTGAFFCFYVPAAAAMLVMLGGKIEVARDLLIPPQSVVRAPAAPVAMDPLIRAALARHPDCRLLGITPATSPQDSVVLRLATPHTEDRGDDVMVAFDQYNGAVLRDLDSRQLGFALRTVLFMGPLHFGAFAGHWSRIAWIVVGLSPGLLFVTGFLMWWRRIAGKRQLARKRADAEKTSVAAML